MGADHLQGRQREGGPDEDYGIPLDFGGLRRTVVLFRL